jgi:hypothetical protein
MGDNYQTVKVAAVQAASVFLAGSAATPGCVLCI